MTTWPENSTIARMCVGRIIYSRPSRIYEIEGFGPYRAVIFHETNESRPIIISFNLDFISQTNILRC